ncbi:arrestin domain-containing protein 2-like isoform X2 [Plodia interpunctella]|uniref:arrestin domain-containing protein 2-like isoform X2 n=1 Tax=Plodia interpunctella TaxID=58824 RepID=UPI002368764B|nr:arrestin domain-containing protein 2-like isoform X2 [Plodia interpunctella]
MTWESCTVMLNSDSTGSVYAGDIVTGTVTMEFTKKKFIENIDFQIIGFGEAQWTRSKPTMPYIKIYSEKRKLLHIEMDVFGNTFDIWSVISGRAVAVVVLLTILSEHKLYIHFTKITGRIVNPGIYHFPFHFTLPEDLLSTFESSIAKVRYSIKIKMKGMWKPKMTIPFVVLGNVNLNSIEEFAVPSTHIFQKTFWNSKHISVRLKTYEGFASKQKIPMQLKIDNDKKARINKIKVQLIQKVNYSIFDGHAEEERTVYHIEHNKLSNSVTETCNLTLDIPSTTPSTVFTTDAMIVISYVLRVEIIFLFHATLYENIPVTIATVPVIHNEFGDQ